MGHGTPDARGCRAFLVRCASARRGWWDEGGRARVPGEWFREDGRVRGEFHDTLRETDEIDEMHRTDNLG